MCAEAAVLAVQYAAVRRLQLRCFELRSAGMIAGVAVLGVLLLFGVRAIGLSALMTAILGAVCYFCAVYAALLALGEPVLREAAARLRKRISRSAESASDEEN